MKTFLKKALLSLVALSVAAAPASANIPVTQFTYDSASRVASTQTGAGTTVGYGYDSLNSLSQELWPGGAGLQYQHFTAGGLARVIDPRGLATGYARDGFGQATSVSSPDSGNESLTFDEAGNLKTRTLATGAVQSFTYDAENRLKSIDSGDAQTVFHYDTAPNGIGKLASMQDASGQTSWAYDIHGNVTSRVQGIQGAPGSLGVSYTHDAGRLTSITYPSGAVLTYVYQASKVTSISLNGQTLVSNVQYQPFGPPKSWQMGNIGTYSRTFDTAGRVVVHTHENGQRQLTWDAANRLTGIQQPDGSTWAYTYDALDRLVSAQEGTQGAKSYGLDWVGNRTSVVENGTNYAFGVASNSNRLATAAGPSQTYSYQHDAAGRIIGDSVRTFQWTNAGLLASATNGPLGASYLYNGLEQRVKKTTAQGARYYVYAEDGLSLLGEYQQQGAGPLSAVNEIVYLEGIPVAVLKGGQAYFIQVDHLETPRTIKNAAGAVVWRWDSDAFGVGAADQNPGGLFLFEFNGRFPGQQFDAETGLHYNNARYYDPATGRYISSDPIGLAGGLSTYGYALQSPGAHADPSGNIVFAPLAVPLGVRGLGLLLALGYSYSQWTTTGSKAVASSQAQQPLQLYATYKRYNPNTGQWYCGKTSGAGSVKEMMSALESASRHRRYTREGFGPFEIDQVSYSEDAIRGREQHLIDFYGGARSTGGTARNTINSISDLNLRGRTYSQAALTEFGSIPDNSPPRYRVWK